MSDYVDTALFLYDPADQNLLKKLENNACGVRITAVSLQRWLAESEQVFDGVNHVVIAASMGRIKQLLMQSAQYDFSVGIIPIEGHEKMARFLDLPARRDDAIEFALRRDAFTIDLTLCNDKVMLFRATIGWLPLLDEPGKCGPLRAFYRGLAKLARIELKPLKIVTAQQKTIKTAASGAMLLQRHRGSVGSSLTENAMSLQDGAVGLVVTSPRSKIDYLRFLIELSLPGSHKNRRPKTLGFIKSTALRVELDWDGELDVFIDGVRATCTPIECRVLPGAARVNVGPALRAARSDDNAGKDTIKIANLPNEMELSRSLSSSREIPFFSYASEDRFKDLFTSLRQDAMVSANYVALMILSAVLATVGLYLNNAAVIIGAMLLAPLMAPLVSASMGILRADNRLFGNAVATIIIGVIIALASASLTAMAFQSEHVTDEMLGRLNPTLMDLAVALFSGIAAAYSKAHREIAQNLAGVAIAVALVPPLAVAGIGLGNADGYFFLQAFLLFMTNLVGIILAAVFTFRVLGYSPVVRNRRGLGVMLLLLAFISVPLYLSYHQIVDDMVFEQRLRHDRFLVNGKYLLVDSVKVTSHREDRVELNLDILAREPLTRDDLHDLKKKLQTQYDEELVVHANVVYTL